MILNILTFIVSVLRGLAEKQWTTKGVADWEDGIWKITYQPCVRCAEQLLTRKKQICKP